MLAYAKTYRISNGVYGNNAQSLNRLESKSPSHPFICAGILAHLWQSPLCFP